MTRTRALITLAIVLVAVLTAAVAFDSARIFELSGHLTAQQTQLKQSNLQQLKNRVINVAHWCGAINAGRDYDRAFVKATTDGHAQYTLPDLSCKRIENKTAISATPQHALNQ